MPLDYELDTQKSRLICSLPNNSLEIANKVDILNKKHIHKKDNDPRPGS